VSQEWFKNKALWNLGSRFQSGVADITADQIRQKVNWFVNHADQHPGHRVLDAACGIGHHAHALAKKGLKVTGIDLCPHLFVANPITEKYTHEIEFSQCDLREIDFQDSFDAITSFGYSLGYFANDGENVRVLQNFFRALKPNGKLFIELWGKEIFQSVYPSVLIKENNGEKMLRCARVTDDWQYFESVFHLIKGETITYVETQKVRLYSATELKDILRHVGFTVLNVWGNYDNAPYDLKATNLLILCQK